MSGRGRRVVAGLVVGVTAVLYAAMVALSAADGDLGATLAGAGVLAFAVGTASRWWGRRAPVPARWPSSGRCSRTWC